MRLMSAARRVTSTARGRKTGSTSTPMCWINMRARSRIEVETPVPTLRTAPLTSLSSAMTSDRAMSCTWMKSIDCSPSPSMIGASPLAMRRKKVRTTDV